MRERLQSAKAIDLSRKLASLLAAREKEMWKQRLLAPTSTGEIVIEAEEIDWIEADDYYAVIHVLQESHFIRESLASLEQRLDSARFIRVHRSAIVNLDHVREVRNESGETWLLLANGTRVPVSRRRRTRALKLLRRLRK
jgi:two-component system LytT family response regulator